MTTAGSIKRHKDDLATGTRIGRYRIEHPVGRGGMGTVYRAFDSTTNRIVALKLLAKGIPATLRERFLAECEAEANIRHEHVMPVYDRGWWTEEQPYFVMELLYEPITLTEIVELIQQGKLASAHPRLRHWNDQRRLMGDVLLPICEGVHVANEEYGVQHRDLKPDNVLIDIRTRRAYLIDFGICRDLDDDTDVGKIVGTPRYLSPEQASAKVDSRTDVWGLGALLRYVVTGEPPIRGTSPFTRDEVDKRIAALKVAEEKAKQNGEEAKARGFAGRRKQLEDPELRVQDDLFEDARIGTYEDLPESTSAGLAAIINKATSADPALRYQKAGALAADLGAWLKGSGVSALAEAGAGGAAVDWAKRLLNRNVVRGVGALVALAIGFLLGTGLFTQTPPAPDHRVEDTRVELQILRKDYLGLMSQAQAPLSRRMGVLGITHQDQLLRQRFAHVKARVDEARQPPTKPQDAEDLETRLSDVRGRIQPSEITLESWSGGSWSMQRLLDGLGELTPNAAHTAKGPAGVYKLKSQDQRLYMRLTLPVDPTARSRRFKFVSANAEIPAGLRWVPEGTAEAFGGRVVRAFLVDVHWVTNDKFAEWLDDMPASERADLVPPTGFRQDPGDQSRWLVVEAMRNKPVLGVSPKSAGAYAAWRAAAEGMAWRLPTDAQWCRMAAVDQFSQRGAAAIFPFLGAKPWRARHRRGEPLKRPLVSREFDYGSPFGFRRLFTGPGEIVQANDGTGFVVKGKGGVLPSPTGIVRSEPLDPNDRDHPYGFRLVLRP